MSENACKLGSVGVVFLPLLASTCLVSVCAGALLMRSVLARGVGRGWWERKRTCGGSFDSQEICGRVLVPIAAGKASFQLSRVAAAASLLL